MAEEYVVEVKIQNEDELKNLEKIVNQTAKSVQSLSESVKRLAENQQKAITAASKSSDATRKETEASKAASAAVIQHSRSLRGLRIALTGVAASVALVTAAYHSKNVTLQLSQKLYEVYVRYTRRAALATASFATSHRTLGTLIFQSGKAVSDVIKIWAQWAKGAISSATAATASINSVRAALQTISRELVAVSKQPFLAVFGKPLTLAQKSLGKVSEVLAGVHQNLKRAAFTISGSFRKGIEAVQPVVLRVSGLFSLLISKLRALRDIHPLDTFVSGSKRAYTATQQFIKNGISVIQAAVKRLLESPVFTNFIEGASKSLPAVQNLIRQGIVSLQSAYSRLVASPVFRNLIDGSKRGLRSLQSLVKEGVLILQRTLVKIRNTLTFENLVKGASQALDWIRSLTNRGILVLKATLEKITGSSLFTSLVSGASAALSRIQELTKRGLATLHEALSRISVTDVFSNLVSKGVQVLKSMRDLSTRGVQVVINSLTRLAKLPVFTRLAQETSDVVLRFRNLIKNGISALQTSLRGLVDKGFKPLRALYTNIASGSVFKNVTAEVNVLFNRVQSLVKNGILVLRKALDSLLSSPFFGKLSSEVSRVLNYIRTLVNRGVRVLQKELLKLSEIPTFNRLFESSSSILNKVRELTSQGFVKLRTILSSISELPVFKRLVTEAVTLYNNTQILARRGFTFLLEKFKAISSSQVFRELTTRIAEAYNKIQILVKNGVSSLFVALKSLPTTSAFKRLTEGASTAADSIQTLVRGGLERLRTTLRAITSADVFNRLTAGATTLLTSIKSLGIEGFSLLQRAFERLAGLRVLDRFADGAKRVLTSVQELTRKGIQTLQDTFVKFPWGQAFETISQKTLKALSYIRDLAQRGVTVLRASFERLANVQLFTNLETNARKIFTALQALTKRGIDALRQTLLGIAEAHPFSKLSAGAANALGAIRGLYEKGVNFLRLSFKNLSESRVFERISRGIVQAKSALIDFSKTVVTSVVNSVKKLPIAWASVVSAISQAKDKVVEMGGVVVKSLGVRRLGIIFSLSTLGTILDKTRNKILLLGAKFKEFLGERGAKIGLTLAKPFIALIGSLSILTGKILKLFPAARKLGSAFTTVGFSLASVSSFSRAWHSVLGSLNKTMPGVAGRLQKVSKGFSDVTASLNIQQQAIPRLLKSWGKVAAQYFLIYKANITLAHIIEAVGERVQHAGELILESFSESYKVSSEMTRTQLDLNRAVRRYTELTGDASMTTQDWLKWSDRLAVSSGKNVSEMRRVTGSLLDFAALYKLNQAETKRFISLMTDVATFLGTNVFDALQHVHGALAGYTRSAQILGVNIDHLREKTKFYEEQLRKEGTETGKSVKQKAQMLALIQELSYLHGVNNRVMQTGYGILKQYRVSQELLAKQVGEAVSPILNAYYKILTKVNLAMASPGIGNFVVTMKAAGGAALDLTGRLLKLAGKLFIAIETIHLLEYAMTALNTTFDVFGMTQRTVFAPMVLLRKEGVRFSFTMETITKTVKGLGSYIGTKLINFLKGGAIALKEFAIQAKIAAATLLTVKAPKQLFGPALYETMLPEKGVFKKAFAGAKLMQATLAAQGLVLAKKVTPEVAKHARQVRDAYIVTKDFAGAQKEWAGTILSFTGKTGALSQAWFTFIGVMGKVWGVIQKVLGFFKGFIGKLTVFVAIVYGVYKAVKNALVPAFNEVFGSSALFAKILSTVGSAIGVLGKALTWVASYPLKLFATGIAGFMGVLIYSVGWLTKATAKLLEFGGVFLKVGKYIPFFGKYLEAAGDKLQRVGKGTSQVGDALVKFGALTADNARAIAGWDRLLAKSSDELARLRKELANTMKKHQEELGLNLAVSKSTEALMNAITDYASAYEEFQRTQEEISKGRTKEGKELKTAEELNRRSTAAVQELEKARKATIETFQRQLKATRSQISETKSLISTYSKFARSQDDVVSAMDATQRGGAEISRIWKGLHKVTTGNLGGFNEMSTAFKNLSVLFKDMASKASPQLREALLAEAQSYERMSEDLAKVVKRGGEKLQLDSKLIESAIKIEVAQKTFNNELQKQEALLKAVQGVTSETVDGLSQFARVYTKDVATSAETAARVQLATSKVAEVGARRYEEALNGNVDALKIYRNYLITLQKSQNDDVKSVIKDAKGRELFNQYLNIQVQRTNVLINALSKEQDIHATLSKRIQAHLATLRAQNKVTEETLKLRALLLNVWKDEFSLRTRLSELTLRGLSIRERAGRAEQFLVGALQQSITQYKAVGKTLQAFTDYTSGAVGATTAVRRALVELQGKTDPLSKQISGLLNTALTDMVSREKDLVQATIAARKQIEELDNIIHPTYTSFGTLTKITRDLTEKSQELAKQSGISALAFDATGTSVSDLGNYLKLVAVHQADFGNQAKVTAQDVTALGKKVLGLINTDISSWGARLANVFESLQGKTKDVITANDYLRPALLNTVFGFSSLVKKAQELNTNLTPVLKNVLDSATAMYSAKEASSAYSSSLESIVSLEDQVRSALNAALPPLNAQITAIASGKVQTGEMITKTKDYANMISALVAQLNTLTNAEEKLRESRKRNLVLSSSIVFSTQQMYKSTKELADIAVVDLIKQYEKAGVVLSESQKKALEDITRTTSEYQNLISLSQKRVEEFTKFVDAKLLEQTRAWTRNKDEIQAFADGLKTVGESAAQGILKHYSDIQVKIEEMGGFFGALGELTQETVAQTAVNAFEELNNAIIQSLIYGKQFQLNWQDILRSFAAGLAQAMLKLLEFKLAMAALNAMGLGIPGMGGGGGGTAGLGVLLRPFMGQEGGTVPGTGRGDKVPAMLEPGEYVIPRPVVNQMGVEFFDALRRGVSFPHPELPRRYQAGGLVTPMQQPEQKVTVVTIFDEKELNKYYSSPTYGKVVANNVGERIARRTG